MNVELITREDLQKLRRDLLEDLKQFISNSASEPKKWLKSSEVRKLLNISSGTLQNLRINGELKPNKIGGTFYYALQDIQSLLQSKTTKPKK
ncbi:helix-turn-helix domain-containing protein [Dyadobacter sp.]|uniref:helix-turn-helix domain-containing protein n=1 Tax=Dyadobacter sp. TaxID=1914288 RepID=UPI003F712F0D